MNGVGVDGRCGGGWTLWVWMDGVGVDELCRCGWVCKRKNDWINENGWGRMDGGG